MLQICKKDVSNTVKILLTYCVLSTAFSFVGIFLAEKSPLENNPLGGLTLHEISGHILFGLVAGTVTLSLRYTIIAGVFAVLVDSDHLIGLTHIDTLGRMSHSISFGVIAFAIMMILFGKKDWRLGAIAFAAVFSHISFDIFAGDPKFPIFAPWYNHMISFPKIYWLYFEIISIIIIGIATIFTSEKKKLQAKEQ
ncbi:MAG TPA: hypothetical protein VJ571_06640 [Candidatus Nitrosotalea sp.]|nr:hypothetical protein [Candidatus Nitrosotalea sp.]